MLIGLTGTYCAGKNRVAELLEEAGVPVLDVDRLGHICIENRKREIFARFGSDLANPDGSVNRKALGERVFARKEELSALEKIVHPEANRMTDEWVEARGGKTCAVNAALLHRSSVFARLDRVILVRAPLFTRLLRAKRRDGLPWPDLLRRFASQRQFNSQYLSSGADIYIVENPGTGKPEALRRGLEKRLREIMADAKPGNETKKPAGRA